MHRTALVLAFSIGLVACGKSEPPAETTPSATATAAVSIAPKPMPAPSASAAPTPTAGSAVGTSPADVVKSLCAKLTTDGVTLDDAVAAVGKKTEEHDFGATHDVKVAPANAAFSEAHVFGNAKTKEPSSIQLVLATAGSLQPGTLTGFGPGPLTPGKGKAPPKAEFLQRPAPGAKASCSVELHGAVGDAEVTNTNVKEAVVRRDVKK